MFNLVALAVLAAPALVKAHMSIFHPSMYGFNVTQQDFPYDNRPVTPLQNYPFNQWWYHNFLNYPPNPGDVFEWPAGGSANVEIACNKGYTSYWASSEGRTNIAVPGGFGCGAINADGSPPGAIHATNITDVKGCGIAIADKVEAQDVQPADFTVFSVKTQCPWYTDNEFFVPGDMPACTGDNCQCAWFWIHNADSGSEQMYMIGFKCKVTNVKSTAKKIGTPTPAWKCADDTSKCNNGPKQPLYWFQAEGNNINQTTYDPPFYNPTFGFTEGAQNNIFADVAGNTLNSGSKTPSVASTSSVAPATTSTSSPSLPPSSPSSFAAPDATPATTTNSGATPNNAVTSSNKVCSKRRSIAKRSMHKKRSNNSFTS